MHCSNEAPSQFENKCFPEVKCFRSRASKQNRPSMLLKSVTSTCVGQADYEMPLVWHRCAMKKAARCTLLNFFEGRVGGQIYNLLQFTLCTLFFEGREGVVGGGVKFTTYNLQFNSGRPGRLHSAKSSISLKGGEGVRFTTYNSWTSKPTALVCRHIVLVFIYNLPC